MIILEPVHTARWEYRADGVFAPVDVGSQEFVDGL
jgi:hypothetical protein